MVRLDETSHAAPDRPDRQRHRRWRLGDLARLLGLETAGAHYARAAEVADLVGSPHWAKAARERATATTPPSRSGPGCAGAGRSAVH
jgi:hypothetical protein